MEAHLHTQGTWSFHHCLVEAARALSSQTIGGCWHNQAVQQHPSFSHSLPTSSNNDRVCSIDKIGSILTQMPSTLVLSKAHSVELQCKRHLLLPCPPAFAAGLFGSFAHFKARLGHCFSFGFGLTAVNVPSGSATTGIDWWRLVLHWARESERRNSVANS